MTKGTYTDELLYGYGVAVPTDIIGSIKKKYYGFVASPTTKSRNRVNVRKPRHNPDKPQNKYGDRCQYAEDGPEGVIHCEALYGDTKICKGTRHNCVKIKYHQEAIHRSE